MLPQFAVIRTLRKADRARPRDLYIENRSRFIGMPLAVRAGRPNEPAAATDMASAAH